MAEDPAKAKNAKAIKLSKGGDLDGAIALWKELLEETQADYPHRWVFHKNIGRNHQKQGRNIDAWASYGKAREIKGSSDKKMSKWLGEVEEELSRERERVTVRSDTAGARVLFRNADLEGWRNTPVEWWFAPGSYEVEVDVPLRDRFETRFTVTSGVRKVMLKSPRTGRLVVTASETDAEILVDGKSVGKGHLEKGVSVGKHAVEVRLAGYETWTGEVAVQGGRIASQTVRLKKLHVDVPVEQPVPGDGQKGGGAARTWGWVLLSSAVALAGGGGGTYYMASGAADEQRTEHSRWIGEQWGTGGAVPANKMDEVDADWQQRMDDNVRPLEVATYALWGTAGAAAVTGIILLAVDASSPPREEEASRVVVVPVAGDEAVGMGLTITF